MTPVINGVTSTIFSSDFFFKIKHGTSQQREVEEKFLSLVRAMQVQRASLVPMLFV